MTYPDIQPRSGFRGILARISRSRSVSAADQEWRFYPATKPKRLLSGENSSWNEALMRRRGLDGTWQYRRASQEEADGLYFDRQY